MVDPTALRAAHGRRLRRVPLAVLGAGGVGRALLRQIVANRARHAADYGLALDVRAVADAGGAALAPGGAAGRALDDDALLAIEAHKGAVGALRDLTPAAGRAVMAREAGASPAGSPGPAGSDAKAATDALRDAWAARLLEAVDAPGLIAVDCTASAEVTSGLVDILARGRDVVLANKLPLATDLAAWDAFAAAGRDAAPSGGRARWEATVGAAVPIVATLRRLLAAGDDVASIEGTFSGSLNFLATELRAGRAFSAIVRDARARGFTEPDPRTDLGGVDMARKALILARMLGARLELADVEVEALYPAEMAAIGIEAFMARTADLDEAFARTVAEARAGGGVWRYAARVGPVGASVGPVVVPADSPLGMLRGTDNHVAFHTRWYASSPLVLQGRGAGVDATASGVLSDVVELAASAAIEG